jgi:hypothetical protein
VIAGGGARRWLAATAAVLVVALYLLVWTTYGRLHLPPDRYVQLAPGAAASKLGADFRLVSLQQTDRLVGEYGGTTPADPGAVWVLARLEVTPHALDKNFSCGVVLVARDRTTWSSGLNGVSRKTPSCTPDNPTPGRAYPVEVIFSVPAGRTADLVGVGLQRIGAGPDVLLVPAG